MSILFAFFLFFYYFLNLHLQVENLDELVRKLLLILFTPVLHKLEAVG